MYICFQFSARWDENYRVREADNGGDSEAKIAGVTRKRGLTMKLRHLLVVTSLGVYSLSPAFSQDAPVLKGKAIAQKEKKADVKKPAPRLPNNFGKLSLSAAQKDEIYTILAKHNGQIDALEEQIKQLKDKRDAEVNDVLSAEQKGKLKTLLADAQKKKTDNAANGKDKDEE
jgi:hypothetical protein